MRTPNNIIRKKCSCHTNRPCQYHRGQRPQRRFVFNRRISSSFGVTLMVMILHLFIFVDGQQQYYGSSDNDYNNDGSNSGYYADDAGSNTNTDTLYHDYYASKGNADPYGTGMDNVGNNPNTNNNWMNTLGTAFVGGIGGWIIGSKYHCNKLTKKLYDKHKADQKVLYQQYYNDVYQLQKQNAELIDALEQYIMATSGGGSGQQQKATTSNKRIA